MFLDGAQARARDAIHVIFAGERVRPDYLEPAPDVAESEEGGPFRVVTLEALVGMKLTSYQRKDQVHLLDLLGVGLIDENWCERLSSELGQRLRELIDNPDN